MRDAIVGDALSRSFFERDPDDVAQALLGTLLVVRDDSRERVAMIVETEAYGGRSDPASHAYRGRTKRSALMFGPAGYLYVYLIYGVHWCMNIVTESTDEPSAVLLRGAQLLHTDANGERIGTSLRGPGNLTRGLGISGDDNGIDCCTKNGRVTVHRSLEDRTALTIDTSVRIGVSAAKDRPSRYYVSGHPAVSRFVKPK